MNYFKRGSVEQNSAMLKSLDSLDLTSLETDEPEPNHVIWDIESDKIVQLINPQDELQILDFDTFVNELTLERETDVKVLSIFGNAGEGKSYFLNNLLYGSRVVFKTSETNSLGTQGVWAIYNKSKRLICLDTQPIEFGSSNPILMKCFAISDIVVFKTKAERQLEDTYSFLGQGSNAIVKYFKDDLNNSGHKINFSQGLRTRGPAIFICHEPSQSQPLTNGDELTIEEMIKKKIKDLQYSVDGLGKIFYIPMESQLRTHSAARFKAIEKQINDYLLNSVYRLHRKPEQIFNSLKVLCDRFKGELKCTISCTICCAECELAVAHKNSEHLNKKSCRYVQQYKNKEMMCKKCHSKVVTEPDDDDSWYSTVLGSYYKLVCANCGTIYSNRGGSWFSNQSEESFVEPKFGHVWPGQTNFNNSSSTGMRKALEGVENMYLALYSYTTDYVAPKYWQPNSEIEVCGVCKIRKINISLGNIHHCRSCGKGVCDECSQTRDVVPRRGWDTPVRICDSCTTPQSDVLSDNDENEYFTRRVSETVVNTLKPLTKALSYPKDIITDLVRPSYWAPDDETLQCYVCNKVRFSNSPECLRHHCRRCGNSVCENCSPYREAVPERGWNYPSRVCQNCVTTNKTENQQ